MGPERLAHKLKFYDEFLEVTERLRRQGKGVVICGDVNTAHTEIDLARPKENEKTPGFMPVERAWVSRLVAHGYHDTFRLFTQRAGALHVVGPQDAARAPGTSAGASTTSSSPTSCAAASAMPRILPHVLGSDHCPITLELL